MPDQAMGDRINDRVREFFRKGHKSGNKLYAVETDGSIRPVAKVGPPVSGVRRVLTGGVSLT